VKRFDFVVTAEAADALWIRFKHRAIGDEGPYVQPSDVLPALSISLVAR
jgi:hypothetical protein